MHLGDNHEDQLMTDLIAEITRAVAEAGTESTTANTLLQRILDHFGCVSGTIHGLAGDDTLTLRAHVGIPEPILPRIQAIPVGKGMAGIAAERRAPVQVCNLQTDDSGVARPSAKETQMQGSLVVPVLCGGKLCGTLGVAKPTAYDFPEEECQRLLEIGSCMGPALLEEGGGRAQERGAGGP